MSEINTFGLRPHEARLNITWQGQNGDLPDPVPYDATAAELKAWAREALRAGYVPGIDADPQAELGDFVVDRFPANDARPWKTVMIRPKTPFG